jgi:phosphoesterase RecJ-like protein
MKLLGEALSSLELNADGKVATMIVHQSNAAEELEDLAEYALTVEGVQAGALLRIQNGTIRVSLRGRGAVVVADIARRFGGGGHAKAAGFTHEGDPEDLRLRVVEALSQEVKNSIAHPAETK